MFQITLFKSQFVLGFQSHSRFLFNFSFHQNIFDAIAMHFNQLLMSCLVYAGFSENTKTDAGSGRPGASRHYRWIGRRRYARRASRWARHIGATANGTGSPIGQCGHSARSLRTQFVNWTRNINTHNRNRTIRQWIARTIKHTRPAWSHCDRAGHEGRFAARNATHVATHWPPRRPADRIGETIVGARFIGCQHAGRRGGTEHS